jgi:uncharacterized membrane protein YozB (DUF420 family)
LIPYDRLPALNATLNAASALVLLGGFYQIRQGRRAVHRACMVSAFCLSTAFLISYLTYHAHHGVVHYQGQGWSRTVYFTILITHTFLAALIVPLVLRTLYLALSNRFDLHRQWARWTFPLWLYVSITGVVIYEMLY